MSKFIKFIIIISFLLFNQPFIYEGNYFNLKVWNLGRGGEGDDLCFMNAKRWIPKLKPKVVCMLMPPPGRFQFFDYDFYIY